MYGSSSDSASPAYAALDIMSAWDRVLAFMVVLSMCVGGWGERRCKLVKSENTDTRGDQGSQASVCGCW